MFSVNNFLVNKFYSVKFAFSPGGMTSRPTSALVFASFVETPSFSMLPCAVTTDPTRFGHLLSFFCLLIMQTEIESIYAG